jgi:hypothetical protein
MQINPSRPRLSVTTGGKGVVSHAGARLLCDLADELGLTAALSQAMAPTKKRRRGHDRGEVLVDLAVALADGATTISDLRVLADQPGLFGEVASVPTTWRTWRPSTRPPWTASPRPGPRPAKWRGRRGWIRAST